MGHLPLVRDGAPALTAAQVKSLGGLVKAAKSFLLVPGTPGEIVVQGDDGRSWLLDVAGAAHPCDDLQGQYDPDPYPRHPLRDYGCPTEGCPARVPLLADGALLGSALGAIAESLVTRRVPSNQRIRRGSIVFVGDGFRCAEHERNLEEVPRGG